MLYRLPNGAILRCGECGVVFRENQVDRATARSLYDDDGYLETPYFEALKVGHRRDVEPWLLYNHALSRLETLTQGRRLLDVGAAYGAFMELARERGWEVSGLDVSAKACGYAARERALEVFNGTLEEARFPTGHFAAVTLWDVVEHLDRPRKVLREACRVLEPGGVLVILTINQRSLINRAGHLLHSVAPAIAARPLVLLYDIHHNFFFDAHSLTVLLRKAGFSGRIEYAALDANISRWQNVRIPWVLEFGTRVLDLAARAMRQRYRLVLFAQKPSRNT